MNDLISKEISQSKKYISENGLIKFYEKSKYLSKVWELYKTKFDKFSTILSIVTPNTKKDIEKEFILRPFQFIIAKLKTNFDLYYTNRELIIKKIPLDLGNGKILWGDDIRLGKKTNHYNIDESEIKSLMNELFLMSNGFLIPLLSAFRDKSIITGKQLKELKKKLPEDKNPLRLRIIKYHFIDRMTLAKAVRKANKEIILFDYMNYTAIHNWIGDNHKKCEVLIDCLKNGWTEDTILDKEVMKNHYS